MRLLIEAPYLDLRSEWQVKSEGAARQRDRIHRTSMTDGTRTTSYSYDNDGRLRSVTNGAGATVDYGYDTAGDITSVSYPTVRLWFSQPTLASLISAVVGPRALRQIRRSEYVCAR